MTDKVCENMLCDEPLTGKQQHYCSDKCRMQAKRSQPEQESDPQPEQTQPEQPTRTASYQDYIDNPEDYAKRSKPEDIDWDNRSPIPGDWDYDGVCEKINGVWQVKDPKTNGKGRKHTDIDIIEQPELSTLPHGVTHPQGQRNEITRDMAPADLHRRIQGHGAAWIQSPEYAEQIYRFQTMTLDQLEDSGQAIPMWRKIRG